MNHQRCCYTHTHTECILAEVAETAKLLCVCVCVHYMYHLILNINILHLKDNESMKREVEPQEERRSEWSFRRLSSSI